MRNTYRTFFFSFISAGIAEWFQGGKCVSDLLVMIYVFLPLIGLFLNKSSISVEGSISNS